MRIDMLSYRATIVGLIVWSVTILSGCSNHVGRGVVQIETGTLIEMSMAGRLVDPAALTVLPGGVRIDGSRKFDLDIIVAGLRSQSDAEGLESLVWKLQLQHNAALWVCASIDGEPLILESLHQSSPYFDPRSRKAGFYSPLPVSNDLVPLGDGQYAAVVSIRFRSVGRPVPIGSEVRIALIDADLIRSSFRGRDDVDVHLDSFDLRAARAVLLPHRPQVQPRDLPHSWWKRSRAVSVPG